MVALATVLAAALLSFTLSAAAGQGGSLLLLPVLSAHLGVKQGVAVAALLLGMNNIMKVVAYRSTIPWRTTVGVLSLTVVGAALGSWAMLGAPEPIVIGAVIASIGLTLALERTDLRVLQRRLAIPLACGAGAVSGFSGTSGPLKGAAVRSFRFERAYFVGAVSAVSLLNDATKAIVFVNGGLIVGSTWLLVAAALPLMLLGTTVGRLVNSRAGEARFAGLFWAVMAGYTVRLLIT